MQANVGVDVPTNAMFDVQIKRIHEYKRQHLNMFSIINRYLEIKAASPEERKKFVPRVCVFGGKAASAYYMAKKMIRLVTAVGEVVNNDSEVGDLLKVRSATAQASHSQLCSCCSWAHAVCTSQLPCYLCPCM